MTSVLVVVPGDPVGKGRPRIGKRGNLAIMFTPPATVEYENAVKREAALSMQGRELFAGPVELWLEIYMPIPPSYPKKKAQAARDGLLVPTKKPDGDNVIKAICDALNGVVWVDDTQVVDYIVKKRFADTPCCVVRVSPLDLLSC